jgi:hypothetical protein
LRTCFHMFPVPFSAALAVKQPYENSNRCTGRHADNHSGRGLIYHNTSDGSDQQAEGDKNTASKAGLAVFCS